jgi:predicted enzyme related to lactoylglutathione lyase
MTTSVVYVFDNQLFNNHEIKEYMMLKQIFFKIIFHSKSYSTYKFINQLNYPLMKKTVFYFLSILILTGWNLQNRITAQNQTEMEKQETKKGRVTGIGGIFFKSNDPEKSRKWYNENLGMATDEYGTMFEFRLASDPDKKGNLQWSVFPEKTKYFDPSSKEFMINYSVENIEALVEELKSNGVTVLDTIETYDYGKFVHIMDLENNKIELWEPVYGAFNDVNKGNSTK